MDDIPEVYNKPERMRELITNLEDMRAAVVRASEALDKKAWDILTHEMRNELNEVGERVFPDGGNQRFPIVRRQHEQRRVFAGNYPDFIGVSAKRARMVR